MALRLLLADESSSIKKAFDIALKDFGTQIKAVHQGMDVKEIFEEFKPDICFIDTLLPKRNGYEVATEIKKKSSNPDTPVVLMWSSFMELDKTKFKKSDANSSLEKPFDSKKLREIVTQLLPQLNNNEISNHIILDEDIQKFTKQNADADFDSEDDEKTPAPAPPPPQEKKIPQQLDKKPEHPEEPSEENFDIPSLESPPDFEPNQDFDSMAPPPPPVGFEDFQLDSDNEPDNEEDNWSHGEPINLPPENLDDVESFSVSSLDDLPIEYLDKEDNHRNTPPESSPPLEDAPESEDFESNFDFNDEEANESFSDKDQSTNDLPPVPSMSLASQEDSDFDSEEEFENYETSDEMSVSEPTSSSEQEKPLNSTKAAQPTPPQLSEEELKRIIMAQSKDIIESVVWDVVPELAKEMIQKEIKRLTGEIKYEEDNE